MIFWSFWRGGGNRRICGGGVGYWSLGLVVEFGVGVNVVGDILGFRLVLVAMLL